MKKLLFIGMILIGFSAFGQTYCPVRDIQDLSIQPLFINFDLKIAEAKTSKEAAVSISKKVETIQIMTSNCSAGVMESKDYPQTSTVTGAVFTSEYIKYTPRY